MATIWAQQPPKAVINVEPSYEHSGRRGVGEGWWQGHEAWSNVCAGATMGVGYGAASLWQWRLHPDEPGHAAYFLAADAGWREALGFEGSRYVGLVGKILDGLPLADAEPCWDVSTTPAACSTRTSSTSATPNTAGRGASSTARAGSRRGSG